MKANCNIDHEIIRSFTPLVQTPGLFICIVIENWDINPSYAVYMRHGCPGGQFWRSGRPIRREKSMQEAQELVNQLAGLVDAYKHFPVYRSDRLGHYVEVEMEGAL